MLGGPCTIGPGMVVGTGLEETIRSHTDIQKNERNARYTKEAIKFYTGITQKAVAAGHAIDVFVGSLDQVGIHEMRSLSERTGGSLVMSDSFSVTTFKDSLRKLLEPDSTAEDAAVDEEEAAAAAIGTRPMSEILSMVDSQLGIKPEPDPDDSTVSE